jgi:hypothetical protein
MVMLRSPLEIPAKHQSLFGESELIPPQLHIIEEEASVIPCHFNIRENKD